MAVIISKEKCTGCGKCVSVCPVDAISMVNDKAVVDDSACADCGACVPACSHGAISF